MGWAFAAALATVVCVAAIRVARGLHRERLRAVRGRSRQIGEVLEVADLEFPFGDTLDALGRLVPFDALGDARLVAEAGYPRGLTKVQLVGGRILAASTGALLAVLVASLTRFTPQVVLGMLFLALAGFYSPTPWLRSLAKRRGERARAELPEALDLIAVMMHGGLSFERGLEEAATAFLVLGAEFRRIIQDLSLGATRQEALERFEQRVPGTETRLFVSSVRQATRMGTPLSSVLQSLADDVRRQRVEGAKQKGAKAATLMAFPMAVFILPAIFLLVGGPVFLRQM